jgi:hypothetical protein
VFENRVLRIIFGPKRDEVTEGWRKLHNEELHNMYSSPSIIRMIKSRRMKWSGHVARIGRRRIHIGCWGGGKPKGKKPLGKSKRRWEDNVKIDFREIGLSAMNWIDLTQDRDQWSALVNTIMNLPVPQNFRKFFSSCATGGFSRRAHLHGVSYATLRFGMPVYSFILSSYKYYMRREVLQVRYVIFYIPCSIVSLLKQDVLRLLKCRSF